jgi:hypothetical protein
VMNDAELDRLMDDHYVGEAQTLTTGAEHNLLKLAELRGTLTAEQASRWQAIKNDFQRVKMMGGAEDDPVARVTGTLSGLADRLDGIQSAVRSSGAVAERLGGIEQALRAAAEVRRESTGKTTDGALEPYLQRLEEALQTLAHPTLEVRVHNEPPPGVEELLAQQIAIIERTLVPLVRTTTQHMHNPVAIDARIEELLGVVRALDQRLREGRTGVYGS